MATATTTTTTPNTTASSKPAKGKGNITKHAGKGASKPLAPVAVNGHTLAAHAQAQGSMVRAVASAATNGHKLHAALHKLLGNGKPATTLALVLALGRKPGAQGVPVVVALRSMANVVQLPKGSNGYNGYSWQLAKAGAKLPAGTSRSSKGANGKAPATGGK